MKNTLDKFKVTRRQVLKAGLYGGAGMMLPLRFIPAKAFANTDGQACIILDGTGTTCYNLNLSDPSKQPKFVEPAPNALDPGFLFKDLNENGLPAQKPNFSIRARETVQETGLINPKNGRRIKTKVWGYGNDTISWPGQTIQVMNYTSGGDPETVVRWSNELRNKHLLPVDTTMHWCYSLHGHSSANGVDYRQFSIRRNGVPIITHLHGGHSDFLYDGNPEFFYSPDGEVKGPQWFTAEALAEGGFTTTFRYDNDVPAGNMWYHDHALGITRLNVYAGLAGFYFVRDNQDTGLSGNPLGLPAFPYELAYAIQDRMFTESGSLFYPAFPGDPFWFDFITDQGLADGNVPQPSALAEFFGDHMVVNGKIWPKVDVEPRNYRLHLLNGTDSRFMAIQFFEVPDGVSEEFGGTNAQDIPNGAIGPLDFTVIGSDQGLASAPTPVNTLVSEPGSRYDIIFDFKSVAAGNRVIMKNIGGDAPFGGDLPGEAIFEHTDKVMAFDVVLPFDDSVSDVSPTASDINFGPNVGTATRTRKVALFEGKDEFGRLQPLLGTAEPATDYLDVPIEWPDTPEYTQAVLPDGTPSPLTGQIEGSIAWHSPTTENPALDYTEEWEIWNVTGDAHPVHLHLVNFEVLNYDNVDSKSGRQEINYDGNIDEDGFVPMSSLATALTQSNETEVVVTDDLQGIPAAGTLRVVDNSGVYRVVDYTAYNAGSKTFTVPATDFSGVNASVGNNVYVTQDDGIFKIMQPTVQHNSVAGDPSTYGVGFRIIYPSNPDDAYGNPVPQPAGYVENAPKDMVTALPDQITRIKATFDKDGRYVWHCHILSHEDHEMMRVLHVGPGA